MSKDTQYPIFPKEKFVHGDWLRIQKLSGRSIASVHKTLIYGTRHDQKVIAAAKKVVALNEAIERHSV